MSNLKINDLQPNGMELFDDSESYLRELSDEELQVKGGGITTAVFSTNICIGVSIGIVVTGAVAAALNGKNKPQT